MTYTQNMSEHISIMLIPEGDDSGRHLTLGYFGTRDLPSAPSLEEVSRAASRLVLHYPAIVKAKINGTGIFNLPDATYAYVDLVDSLEIEALRNTMLNYIRPYSEHGFIPHMTKQFTETPFIVAPTVTRDIVFDRIRASHGNMYIDYGLARV